MNELTLMNINGIETVDSRQVAEAVGKNHYDLLRDVRKYCDYLNESKIAVVDFFIESTYADIKGEERPCYLCTRKGCEMIANKLMGQKGVAFTALYINAFHKMENHIKEQKPLQTAEDKAKALEIRLINAQARAMNARVKVADMWLKIGGTPTLSEEYKNVCAVRAANELAGNEILALPKSEQKTYSAGDIAEMFGVSAQKVGRVAKANNMKTDEYGEWYRDKSPYSNKEVDTFRYNDKAIEKLRELLK